MDECFHAGQKFSETFSLDSETIKKFAEFSGDSNPLHLVETEAHAYGFRKQVAHGAIQTAFISKMIGMRVPGPGAVWMDHEVRWKTPVFVGDDLTLEIEITQFSASSRILKLAIVGKNQDGQVVMEGSATVKIAMKMAKSVNPTNQSGPRVVLVTGGSGGIGSEIVRLMAVQGYRVAIGCSRPSDRARALAEEASADGNAVVAVVSDLSAKGGGTDLVRQVVGEWGRLDIVVHAASPKIDPTPIGELSYAAISQFADFYLRNAHEIVLATLPSMQEHQFGRHIFLGTSSTMTPPPAGLSAYVTGKTALAGYCRSLAVELGSKGCTANVVSPGMTLTEFSGYVPPRIKEVEAFKNPRRRLASPGDIAPLVCFLASDAAEYINGANLPVSGGPLG